MITRAGKRVALAALADTDDLAVPAVVMAEYTVGVLRETGPRTRRRATRVP